MGFHLWHYVCTQKFSYFGVLWILDCHGFWISDAQPIVTVETVEELCGLLRVVHGIGGHLTHGRGHRPHSLEVAFHQFWKRQGCYKNETNTPGCVFTQHLLQPRPGQMQKSL